MTAERAGRWLALAAIAAIALLAAVRLGVFAPWATVDTPAGPVRVANALAGVDHPFHAARAEVLRRSLLAGENPRWIGNHQGGYPVEFYPLGAAWLAVAAWALAFGALPIGWAYGASVLAILVLPGVGFWLLARRDGLPAGTAALAVAAHVAVPGAWWHGGYTELVQWGLVTNVAGAAWAMLVLPLLLGWLRDGRGRDGALAMAAAAAAILSNPRSAFGLAVVGIAAVLACLPPVWSARAGDAAGRRRAAGGLVGRAALVGVGAGLLAAPELVALARFSGLYVFKHYGAYAGPGDYLRSAVDAVSLPVFLAALVGVVLACSPWGRDRPGTRAAALALPLYAGLTWSAASGALPVGQLEATRLMPLQRLLTVWLAAAAAGMILERVRDGRGTAASEAREGDPRRSRVRWPSWAAAIGPLALAAALLGWWLRPGGEAMPLPGPPEAPVRGLYPVARTADGPAFADLERAVRAADTAAPPGTAVLVLGSALSWHAQLWAPMWSDRPFLYDDWLWYWRTDHAGTPAYGFDRGHFYPDPERALDPDFLARHGVGAVVATGPAMAAAGRLPWLDPLPAGDRGGVYRAWSVRSPTALLTVGDVDAADASYAPGRVGGRSDAEGPAEAVVRHAWFPRWLATTDGVPAPVARAPDGTMRVPAVPPGARLELRYGTDGWDWAARALALAGLALALRTWLPGKSRSRGVEESRSRGETMP